MRKIAAAALCGALLLGATPSRADSVGPLIGGLVGGAVLGGIIASQHHHPYYAYPQPYYAQPQPHPYYSAPRPYYDPYYTPRRCWFETRQIWTPYGWRARSVKRCR